MDLKKEEKLETQIRASPVFLRALGTPEVNQAPPQTESLALRATEEWERFFFRPTPHNREAPTPSPKIISV